MMTFRVKLSLIQPSNTTSVTTNTATERRNPKYRASMNPTPKERMSPSELTIVSTVIADRGSDSAIPLDNAVRVLHYFPQRLKGNGKPKPPERRHSRNKPRKQSVEYESMKHVCDAVGIREFFGCACFVPEPGQNIQFPLSKKKQAGFEMVGLSCQCWF